MILGEMQFMLFLIKFWSFRRKQWIDQLKVENFTESEFPHKYFPGNFPKFQSTSFKNNPEQLLLKKVVLKMTVQCEIICGYFNIFNISQNTFYLKNYSRVLLFKTLMSNFTEAYLVY